MNHRTDSATRHDLVTTRGAPRVRRRITHEVTNVGVGPKVGWASCTRNTFANLRASFEGMVDPLLTTRCPLYIRKRTYALHQAMSAKGQKRTLAAYSIISSAICWRCRGTLRPSVLAVFRLITKSNLLGCKTGRSAGFSPLSTRPV